jgi:hypothetical protein
MQAAIAGLARSPSSGTRQPLESLQQYRQVVIVAEIVGKRLGFARQRAHHRGPEILEHQKVYPEILNSFAPLVQVVG